MLIDAMGVLVCLGIWRLAGCKSCKPVTTVEALDSVVEQKDAASFSSFQPMTCETSILEALYTIFYKMITVTALLFWN